LPDKDGLEPEAVKGYFQEILNRSQADFFMSADEMKTNNVTANELENVDIYFTQDPDSGQWLLLARNGNKLIYQIASYDNGNTYQPAESPFIYSIEKGKFAVMDIPYG
jgi:hypothetical protein